MRGCRDENGVDGSTVGVVMTMMHIDENCI